MNLPTNSPQLPSDQIIVVDPEPTPQKEARDTFESELDRTHRLNNKSFEQDIKERKKYAILSYKISRRWISFIIFVTFSQFFARLFGKGLNDAEFIAVVTTTTASVFGYWWLVGRYLFKGPDRPDPPSALDKK